MEVVREGTTMATSSPPSPGGSTALGTVDIVVLVVYFLVILAVGFWVSEGGNNGHFWNLSQAFYHSLAFSSSEEIQIGVCGSVF